MNCILEFIACLVEAMRWIHIVPKRMVNSVDAHFHYHKKIPLFLRKKMAGNGEPLTGHLVKVSQHLGLIAGAKIAYVHNVFADETRNFVFELGRMCVIASDIGSQKISDQQSIEWLGRIGSGSTDDNRVITTSYKEGIIAVVYSTVRLAS